MMDRKALNILFNTFWSSAGWKSEKTVAPSDFEYAKSKNVMFDPIFIGHDQTVQWITDVFNQSSKRHIVKCFLSSLSTRQVWLRSGLSSYAFARNFPRHGFSSSGNIFCNICGSYSNEKRNIDLNIMNFERIKWGGVRLTDPIYAAWNLELLHKEATPEPSTEDIDILNQFISAINNSAPSDRPTQLEKKIALIIKSNSPERRLIIDMFGICGILETKEHKGFFESYAPYSKQTLRPLNKSDWSYPVDWWTGQDGINEQALEFYFSEYLK